jgi:4-oxalocrotonate tautomerase
MPEIVVYAVEGRSIEQKQALLRDITDAVVKNFKVDPEAVTVQIVEAPAVQKSKGGVPYSERMPGRSAKP